MRAIAVLDAPAEIESNGVPLKIESSITERSQQAAGPLS